jgi:hypothetical protein
METLNEQLKQLHDMIINKSNELPLLFQRGQDNDAIALCNEINYLNDLYNDIINTVKWINKLNEGNR